MSTWQRLDTKVVYQNDYMTIHEDTVITPDGKPGSYGWVETPPSVFIVAIDNDDKITLIEQTRYVTGRPSWEVPAGSTDGQDPLDAAKRELEEEAGLHADRWVQLTGQTYPWNSSSPEYSLHLIATGLHAARHPRTDTDDVITDTKKVTWQEVFEMIKSGEIQNGQTITALTIAGLHLGVLKP
jgi:8-oxo-dGTP pyrophosphatase MutT (NUDIX family)